MDSSTSSFVDCENPEEKASLTRVAVSSSFGVRPAANASVGGGSGGKGMPRGDEDIHPPPPPKPSLPPRRPQHNNVPDNLAPAPADPSVLNIL